VLCSACSYHEVTQFIDGLENCFKITKHEMSASLLKTSVVSRLFVFNHVTFRTVSAFVYWNIVLQYGDTLSPSLRPLLQPSLLKPIKHRTINFGGTAGPFPSMLWIQTLPWYAYMIPKFLCPLLLHPLRSAKHCAPMKISSPTRSTIRR
jgi:hypothetical protein